MQSFSVTKNEAGQRFDKYLHKLLPNAPMSLVYKMLRKKNITLNKKKADGKEQLCASDYIEMFFSDETFQKFSYSEEALAADLQCYQRAYSSFQEIMVIYEDEHIMILNKPAGLLSQKASIDDLSMNEWMIGYLIQKNHITTESLKQFRPSVCNRLDRNTSGLLLCGKTLPGSQFLSTILKDRSLHKYYITFVEGQLTAEKHLEGYLKKDERTNKVSIIRTAVSPGDDYDYIETFYKPLGYDKKADITALEVLLITGKPHQIRAHLSSEGYPLVGDYKYGSKQQEYKHQLLHAYRIEFPVTEGAFSYLSGKKWIAPLPSEFQKLEETTCLHGVLEA